MKFSEQVDVYLARSAARKRSPLKPTSIAAVRSQIRAALPVLGHLNLEDINSGTLKDLAAFLDREKYSASSIHSILTAVKQVVASDLDANGDPKHPCKWNNDFIDARPVRERKKEVPTATEIQDALAVLESPIREFMATQAASGCRLGELLALNVSDFDSRGGLLRITRTLSRHGETSTKTEAGNRNVDLHPDIVSMLKIMLAGRTAGRLFSVTIDGARGAFNRVGIKSHSLRHFRYTLLRKANVHPTIHYYWIGHVLKGMAAIYDHTEEDIKLRQRIVREVGLGFTLPVFAAPQPAERQQAIEATA